ncbi:MAG: hypothetical protein V5A55_14995 [Halovenus sp.]
MSALDAVAGIRPGIASRERSGCLGQPRRSATVSWFGARTRSDDGGGSRQDGPPRERNSSHVRAWSPGGRDSD